MGIQQMLCYGTHGVPDTAAIRTHLRAAVTSWWACDGAMTDAARVGATFGGSPSYTTGPNGVGQALLGANASPLVTAIRDGFNAYHCAQKWAFGWKILPTSSATTTWIVSFGQANVGTSTNSGCIRIGINGSGQWESVFITNLGNTTNTLSGPSVSLNVFTDVFVDFDGSIFRLWINGVVYASSSAISSTAIQVFTSDAFVIGTAVGTDRYFTMCDGFWMHDNIASADEGLYLHNNGFRRHYTDFSTEPYGTTADAYALALGFDGYWKHDETSGTSLADSAGGLGAATRSNGAVASTFDPPPGFSSSDAVTDHDGVNDFTDYPNVDMSTGTKSWVFGMWVNLDTFVASAYHVYFASDTANLNRRLIASGSSSGDLQWTMTKNDGTTLVNVSGAAGMTYGAWNMLVHYYDDSCKLMLPIKNGVCILTGQVASASPTAILLDENSTMAKLGLSNRSDGKQSRTGVKRGTLSMAQLAKLYDLGAGAT
jgi:hypothetical protein